MSNKPQPPNEPKPRFQIPAWVWSVLMLLATVWFFMQTPTLLSGPASSPIQIPYSFFRAQVTANQVTSVLMQRTLVTGDFKGLVTWPPAGSPETKQIAPTTASRSGKLCSLSDS